MPLFFLSICTSILSTTTFLRQQFIEPQKQQPFVGASTPLKTDSNDILDVFGIGTTKILVAVVATAGARSGSIVAFCILI
jgi:hypothetical protein